MSEQLGFGLPVALRPEESGSDLWERCKALESRILHLIKQVGAPGVCRGCHHQILWVKHANGQPTPYNQDGSPHFASCPNRDTFRKAKSNGTKEQVEK